MPLPQALYRASEVPLHFPPFLFLDRSLILISLFLLTLFFNLILLTLFPSYELIFCSLEDEASQRPLCSFCFAAFRRLWHSGSFSLFLLTLVSIFGSELKAQGYEVILGCS